MEKDSIAIVGGGRDCETLLDALASFPDVCVACVVEETPGQANAARERDIPVVGPEFFASLAQRDSLDILIDVSRNAEWARLLREHKPARATLVPPTLTRLLIGLSESHITSAEAEAEIERIGEEKTRYLLRATHHLKAPFAAIQSYVDVLLGGFAGPLDERPREILSRIRERCDLLSSTIYEMLELAALRTRPADVEEASSNRIEDLLKPVLDCSNILARKHNVTLEVQNESVVPAIFCRAKETTILLQTLIDNAIHYSPENSRVRISVEPLGSSQVRVTVSDQGIGIPRESLGRIFDEYFRCNNAARKHPNGSGLGLSLAKEIAERNHFSLFVTSELGVGSTFSVTAPTAPTNAVRSGAIRDLGDVPRQGATSTAGTPSELRGRAGATSAVEPRPPSGPRIN